MMKIFVLMVMSLVLHATIARAVEIDETLIRNDLNGRPMLTHDEAQHACEQRNSRLPTIREYAEYARARGAKGILETKYSSLTIDDVKVQFEEQLMSRLGYKPVLRDEIYIDFYFNSDGYCPPSGDQGFFWFWTYENSTFMQRYHDFDGLTGRSDHLTDGTLNAARCLKTGDQR